jgi:formylglycine-generating enzyme required for sulfatase activity
MQRRLLGRHTMTFVRIPAGTVPLGAGLPPTLKARSVDSRHQRIERPFWLATTETSTALFRQFVEEGASPATRETIENSPEFIWASDERLPVCGVTYFEAIEFCNWLSRQEGHDEAYVFNDDQWQLVENSNGYRLPTSEEWELACRAGTTTAFPFGEESQLTKLEEYGWCLDVLPIPSIKVGYPAHDLPNDYGLFDMIGNAWELTGTTITPQFGDESSLVDARGGGAHSSLDSFFSGGYAPYLKDRRFLSAGFRIMFRETVAD